MSTLRHARARGAEGDARDALDLLAACSRTGRWRVSAVRGLVAEVDAAGELAHDEQVGALDDLAAQRAGVVERRQRADRAQVGVQAEALAQAEQALLGARRVGVGRVPLRAADRGEQHGVGAAAGGERLVGQRGAVGVDRRRRRTRCSS